MSRLARVDVGESVYHVINRAIGRMQIFETLEDYALFEELLTMRNGDEKRGRAQFYVRLYPWPAPLALT